MPFNPKDFEQYDLFIVSEIEDGFRHVQINHPKTLNSFNEKRWRDYQAVLEKLDQDDDTVVILLSSSVPKAFSSGLDLKEAMAVMENNGQSPEDSYKHLYQHIIDFQYAIATPTRIDTPTICLLNGISYGLAIDIASSCSVRVAVEGAKLSIREIKIGISADMGSLQRMPALVNNQSLLYERALTGSIWSAQDALDWGFVSKVFPDLKSGLDYCIELGSEIAGSQRWAVRGTKKFINESLTGTTTEQSLLNVAVYNATHIDGSFSKTISGVVKGKL